MFDSIVRSLTPSIALVALLGASSITAAASFPAQPPGDDFASLKTQAERVYGEGSYRRALELYQQAARLELNEEDRRWVQFRLGDSMWRNQAATNTNDDSEYQKAVQTLSDLVNSYRIASDYDQIWAEAQESLGDYHWNRQNSRNWNGWNNYRSALDFWAGERDLDLARTRYLGIVYKAAEPDWLSRYPYYRQYVYVPADILENAHTIAKDEGDRSHTAFLLAMATRQQGGYRLQQRVEELFQSVTETRNKSLEWYDDALFYYAEWLSQQGRVVRLDGGQFSNRPDYRGSIELYRRLMTEFRKGETRYYDNAKSRIDEITSPSLGVYVSNFFLPDSEVQFGLNWRNVQAIECKLYRMDLTTDLAIRPVDQDVSDWLNSVDLARAERVRAWTKETNDDGTHVPGSEIATVEEKLPTGAYLLLCTAGGKSARDLVLVGDATLITKTVSDEVLVYVCDALDGSPMPEADVSVWETRYENGKYRAYHHRAKADGQGAAVVKLRDQSGSGNLLVTARKDQRQAFAMSYANQRPDARQEYRIYAYTDRPAYRPGDTVNWKMTARVYRDSTYSTPADQSVYFQINDPQGAKLKDGTLTLNAFGGAHDAFDLQATMQLGLYNVQFWTREDGDWIGSAPLFRLEEYKLPEYEVTVSTPEEDGRRKTYQVGDLVQAEIKADYYFGAPVANADVEVVVYQRPFWHWWSPPRQYGWLYEDSNPYRWNYWGGSGQQIKREQMKTDEQGRAIVSFETPMNTNQDFEYTVEVRVLDSSRREVIASDSVRVTRQKYFVYAKPEHNIYRPKEKVTIAFNAMDANSNPMEAEGTVQVFRDEWKEIWITPDGREVTGTELIEAREQHRVFPPRPEPGRIGWRLKYRGYTSELILSQMVRTDDEGAGELVMTPDREGYYRIEWSSESNDLYPVFAQTTVWVCDDTSRAIGYYHGGVEIIVDKDTFRAGQVAPVMITVPTNDRHVLFTLEGNTLHDWQVVHLEGTVKLLQVKVTDAHVPNVWLTASMVNDGQLFSDQKQVVVPPDDHFLDVEVTMDQSAYEPGQKGRLTVLTRDREGKPVSAEVGLSLVDESVYYIQPELAADPRQFFFNDRQNQQVRTDSMFNQKSFARLIENERGEVVSSSLRRDLNEAMPDDASMEQEGMNVDAMKMTREELSRGGRRRSMAPATASAPGPGGGGAGGQEWAADAREAGALESKSDYDLAGNAGGDGGPGQDQQAVRVRSDFRETALWVPDVVTDDTGRTTVEVDFPDSTSRWKANARVATSGSEFGIGTTSVKTRQPLIARLQAPRFFVVGDYALVSAVLNNNTDAVLRATCEIDLDGLDVERVEIGGRPVADPSTNQVEIPANGSIGIDWRVAVREPGLVRAIVKARAGRHSDGMERTYPIYEHGIEKHVIKSGVVRNDDVTIRVDLPSERKIGSTRVAVQVTPSMAVTMLDALPYLINYPYGCTEQTMSRFLPSAIVARTLSDLGIEPEAAMSRVYGGIEEQFTDQTHPKGRKSLDELNRMTTQGLARLYDFQHSDGGWGWWKIGESDHYMSAYVVWGLSIAKEAGIQVDEGVLARGVAYLRNEIVEEESNYDMQAWMLHALGSYQHALTDNARSEFEKTATENLWKNRDRLNAYTRALFALAVHYHGDDEKARVLVRNLENGVKLDETPDTSVVMRGEQESGPTVMPTAHWGSDGVYWRWSEGGVEATAFALRAMLAIEPDHELIAPVTNWLIKNRRGAQWSNTRDTAVVVMTMADYLRVSGELDPNLEYELSVNGQTIATRRAGDGDLFAAPSRYEIDPSIIQSGRNDVRIVRKGGSGPVYFSIDAQFFSLEEPIEAAGHEIFARRDYYKLVPYPTLLKGYEFDRVPMKDGESVKSGERVEVVLTIETKNNYEYLLFEDLKPAGLEAVQVQSGQPIYAKEIKKSGQERRFTDELDAIDIARDQSDYTGRTAWAYQELRDRNVALFFSQLPEGVWELQYELRAEVPGDFHALPLLGHAMYVPEIRCNSREMRLTVYDRD